MDIVEEIIEEEAMREIEGGSTTESETTKILKVKRDVNHQ